MARIKPQALLNQSKKKKTPSRISISTIIVCNLVVAVVILSLVTTYRHWSQRSRNTIEHETQSQRFEDTNAASEQKSYDLPGYADINTSKGLITVELFKEGSPEVVDKFLDLCQKDHFKGMPFHRVIKNYLVQAGHSPSSIPVEEWTAKGKLRGRLHTGPKHEAFMLGTPKTKGNNKDFELLITTAPIPDLNDQLIVFGRVLKGEDVVQEIEEVDTDEHYQPKSLIGITGVILKREI
ncbi:PREDICTED: peptidyl-prolyl cis-trans isomerase CYP21-4 [Camelina sativa]|uniref:Peptidyl-prolyl cis-trans isomerase n=1 Tax=Camelina sativa TaxID=90675 RepID=A0ABM0ULW0_CAMSA|nr:PREDICTED: peptidyl-prolyl cis-trans isomerase CYP21-4 [Camelina sativa]